MHLNFYVGKNISRRLRTFSLANTILSFFSDIYEISPATRRCHKKSTWNHQDIIKKRRIKTGY